MKTTETKLIFPEFDSLAEYVRLDAVNLDIGYKGEKGDKGDKGDAYIITEDDYEEIAEIAATKIDAYTKEEADRTFTKQQSFYELANHVIEETDENIAALENKTSQITKVDDWGTLIQVMDGKTYAAYNNTTAEAVDLAFADVLEGGAHKLKGSVKVDTRGVTINENTYDGDVNVCPNPQYGPPNESKLYYHNKEVATTDDLEAKQDKLNFYDESWGWPTLISGDASNLSSIDVAYPRGEEDGGVIILSKDDYNESRLRIAPNGVFYNNKEIATKLLIEDLSKRIAALEEALNF